MKLNIETHGGTTLAIAEGRLAFGAANGCQKQLEAENVAWRDWSGEQPGMSAFAREGGGDVPRMSDFDARGRRRHEANRHARLNRNDPKPAKHPILGHHRA